MIQRGLKVTAPGRWELASARLRPPRPGEVTIAAEYLGICGSDLHRIYDLDPAEWGPGLGRPGHEIAGHVLDCPSGRFDVGDEVLVVPLPAQAEGFSDVMNADESRVLPLGKSVGTFRGVLCQQIGTVVHALKRFWPGEGGDTAVVVGGGSAGQAFVALLKRRGFRQVIVADVWRGRLDACRRFGADVTVCLPKDDLRSTVAELTGGRGAPLVIEAAGTPESRMSAMDCVGFRGTVGFFGLPAERPVEEFPFASLFAKQACLQMITGTQQEPGLTSFREAIALIARGELAVEEMVSHRFPLEQIGAALELARNVGDDVRKVLIDLTL